MPATKMMSLRRDERIVTTRSYHSGLRGILNKAVFGISRSSVKKMAVGAAHGIVLATAWPSASYPSGEAIFQKEKTNPSLLAIEFALHFG